MNYVTTKQAASILGCDVKEIRTMCRNGELKHIMRPDGRGYLIEENQPAFRQKSSGSNGSHFTYIDDHNHYLVVIDRILRVKSTLEISCANFKGLTIYRAGRRELFTETLKWLVNRGVKVKLIISDPTNRIEEELDQMATSLGSNFTYTVCLRVHMKVIIFDEEEVYIGSANLTPSAMGPMRITRENNHEAGILTNDPIIVKQTAEHYKRIWSSDECNECKKQNCPCHP